MGLRRKAREVGIQVLYQMEMQNLAPKAAFELFWTSQETPEDKDFAVSLVEGVWRNKIEIDLLIERHSLHWKLPRMAVVYRNILRLGVYELLYLGDVPMNVVLNEAIEIAKKFGTQDSSAFINGVLDRVAREVKK